MCQSQVKHRDYKLRIMKMEGGEKHFIYMERLQCTNKSCNRLHNALPDRLVPYKHYAAEIISGVLDEIITTQDLETEDYPCEATMLRWKHWLMLNYFRINGYLKSIGYRFLGFSEELLNTRLSLLEYLRLSNDRWLEAILRMIYNSGGVLEPS